MTTLVLPCLSRYNSLHFVSLPALALPLLSGQDLLKKMVGGSRERDEKSRGCVSRATAAHCFDLSLGRWCGRLVKPWAATTIAVVIVDQGLASIRAGRSVVVVIGARGGQALNESCGRGGACRFVTCRGPADFRCAHQANGLGTTR